jgi:hypothetical protein
MPCECFEERGCDGPAEGTELGRRRREDLFFKRLLGGVLNERR